VKKNISLLIVLYICVLIGGCADSNTLSEYEAALIDMPLSTLSVSESNVFAVDNYGKLWGWGQNKGNVFQTETEEIRSPVEVLDSVKSVSTGGRVVLVIREDDSLWGWGSNHIGQLGQGKSVEVVDTPVKIMDDVAAVSAEANFSVVLKKDGSLWVSGHNSFGVLGVGKPSNSYEFIKVMENVRSVRASHYNVVAIDRNNFLWAWGINQTYNVDRAIPGGIITDDASQEFVDTPCKIANNVYSARFGQNCIYILKTNGSLIKWQSPKSQEIVLENVKYIDARGRTIAAINIDNSLFCWGLLYTEQNAEGLCKFAENVTYVAVGDQFVSYIDQQNDLYCGGLNYYGLVGNGENTGPTGPPVPDGDYEKTEDDFVYPPIHVLSGIAY